MRYAERIKNTGRRTKNALLALLFLGTQIVFPVAMSGAASALGTISADTSEGQKSDSTWSTGNITTYKEGDYINFRFNVSATGSSQGQMKVVFANDECGFFDGTFTLDATEDTSGALATVSKVGNATLVSSDWEQVLSVNFPAAGTNKVNYTLRLGPSAGQCNGSSTHVSLDNVTGSANGDFAHIGAKDVPIPAGDIIELPEIYVTKQVDTNGDGQPDRNATAGEWSFSLDGGTPVPTDANGKVTFVNVTPDGEHSITESGGPADQTFLSGSGCPFVGSTAKPVIAQGTTPTDATCNFVNTVRKGSLTIVKNATPQSGQVFHFSTQGFGSGMDTTGFSLDDDGNNTNTYSNTKQFSALSTGTYTVTEDNTSGWDFSSLSCDNDAATVSDKTVTFHNTSGQNVTCTYGNTEHGTIQVKKVLSPSADPGKFDLNIGGTAYATNVGNGGDTGSISLSAGTYGVSETGGTATNLTDYTATYACTDNGNQLVSGNGTSVSGLGLAAGHAIVCTFTNVRNTGSVQVNKLLDSDGNGTFETVNPNTFTWSLDGSGANAMGSTVSGVNTGTHSVNESTAANYHLVGWYYTNNQSQSCSNLASTSLPASLAVTTGTTTSITICNQRDTGTLRVLKNVDLNADGDFNDAGETGSTLWGWTANNGPTHSTGDAAITVPTGDYDLAESGPDNFHQTGLSCTGGSLVGSTVTVGTNANVVCTFVNVRDTGLVSFLKIVLGGSSVPGDWTFNISGDNGTAQSGDSKTLLTGSYDITESGPDGYSLTAAGGICSIIDDIVVLTVTTDGGQCSLTNTRDTGSVKVNKLLDSNGDGTYETTNPNDFSWNLVGIQNDNAMGSTVNGVETDTDGSMHTVTENSPADYHFVGWFEGSPDSQRAPCTAFGEGREALPASISVTKNTVTEITLCNARDTGTIKVNKVVSPSKGDDGLFNLQIDNTNAGTGTDVGNGGTTGVITVPTGTHSVREIAGTGTSLDDYISSYVCSNELSGDGTATGDFTVTTGDDVTCTFTNVRKAAVTVIKDAIPNDPQDFSFTLSKSNGDEDIPLLDENTLIKSFSLDDDSDATLSSSEPTTDLAPGTYVIDEASVAGWDLTNVQCGEGIEYEQSGTSLILDVEPGAHITCTFTNVKRGSISVTKYNDLNQDGIYEPEGTDTSPPEPTLDGWQMVLDGDTENAQSTVNGTTTFENLVPDSYQLSEVIPDSSPAWHQSGISCDSDEQLEALQLENGHIVFVDPGQPVNCYVGNYQDAVSFITKSNNQPNPTSTGSNVTYTIQVTIPADSGVVYNGVVTDLPPKGFTYVPGTWTASVKHQDGTTENLKENGTTTEPQYGSPGLWALGTLLPGDIVTLTYQALISNSVTPGTYPDIAYFQGTATPSTESDAILANITTSSTPFVGTNVTIQTTPTPVAFTAAEVLGAKLVATGSTLNALQFVIPAVLIVATLVLRRTTPRGLVKGGTR